ncbi:MAG: hypothetical protein K2K64_04985 [Muribaculaceae bacterium]|nr:hypothetical protein [Muribaculaceae bacterium]MDE7109845.1 hypothetical protein [Muribaculaceae bacterium]
MKTTIKNFQTIDQTISSIFRILSTTASDNSVVVRERPSKTATFCKGIISVFDRNDIRRQEEDKTFRATPIVRYAFYPDTYNPSRIGSIAIYGENAHTLCAIIRKQRAIFGQSVISVSIEKGLRPFIDVRLRA